MNTEPQPLDRIFAALAHPVRRDLLARLLNEREATVTALAAPYESSLNAISRHIKVLEAAGLIEREIVGREHYCRPRPDALQQAADWLAYHQQFWSERLDALDQHIRSFYSPTTPDEDDAP